MTGVAIIKPDHLGDLVLSSPAIRAVSQYFGQATLFVSSGTLPLARFLFPDMELRVVDFPHLAKTREATWNLPRFASELNAFDLVLWLRDDPAIRVAAEQVHVLQDFATGGHLAHESAIQKKMVRRYVGNYSRSALFGSNPIAWPKAIREVGLCVSAGFPTNLWPAIYWLELATALARKGIGLSLIGGPKERSVLALLTTCLGGLPHRTICGGPDFRGFLSALANLDLIIAMDGGTAHICSLEKPVLSLFGASPWRRYAPFGRDNVVITRDLSCSPCVQFSLEDVNGCLSRECMIGLAPKSILDILFASSYTLPPKLGIVMQRGTSHCFEH